MSNNNTKSLHSRRTTPIPIQQIQQPIQIHQQQQSQFNQLKMNNLKISKFDGTTDVNIWIEDFQLNKILLKWTDDELKVIILQFKNQANTHLLKFSLVEENQNFLNKLI